jgi:hypothetical protein
VDVGVANTGWLPTSVTARASKEQLVRPIVAEVAGEGVSVVGGPARQQLAQLEGRAATRFTFFHDGTPDRLLATWVVRAEPGAEVAVTVRHDRAGTATATITLA